MADGSKIEWTDATWNPIVGCSVVSPGCTNCYAMRLAPRTEELSIGTPWVGPSGKLTQAGKAGPVWTGAVRFIERRLDQPLRWKRPRKIFVNSMGDLFHENVPDEWIDRVFAVMALAPQHTFQVLTKRAKRMREYIAGLGDEHWLPPRLQAIANFIPVRPDAEPDEPPDWPLPNVWLGVSVEDQPRADERIPDLLATPAAKRFLSCEPVLGPIRLRNLYLIGDSDDGGFSEEVHGDVPRLDWVIGGGESGANARPMHPDWARSLRDQCQDAGVAFFFKQHGEWLSTRDDDGQISYGEHKRHGWDVDRPGEAWAYRVGKKAAGRLLDGREWSEFPA